MWADLARWKLDGLLLPTPIGALVAVTVAILAAQNLAGAIATSLSFDHLSGPPPQ